MSWRRGKRIRANNPKFRMPLPGERLGAVDEICWQTTLSKKHRKALGALRELGSKASILQLADKLGRTTSGVAHTFRVLESKGKVKKASYDEGVSTVWRIRTWADVDHDHIREMARRGGVF